MKEDTRFLIAGITFIALAMLVFLFAGCHDGPTTIDEDDQTLNTPTVSTNPAHPTKPTKPTKPEKPKPGTVTPQQPGPAVHSEAGDYVGRANGDRPTWRFSKPMTSYPKTFVVTIPGCVTRSISNNGVRYESGGLIVKQSDIAGYGMAIVMASTCHSTEATVTY
jgi:hypothetical protein